MNSDYANGWRYIVWVGGNDDYYKNYNDAKRDADDWIAKGYDDVIIEHLKKEIPLMTDKVDLKVINELENFKKEIEK